MRESFVVSANLEVERITNGVVLQNRIQLFS